MAEKAWNDPPLFSLEQMSRSDSCAINKRHRYPQPYVGEQQQQQQQQPIFNRNVMNSAMQTPNTNQFAANTNTANTGFDLNHFMATINSLVFAVNTIPQQLRNQLPIIQQNLYNSQYDPRVQSNLIYLLNSINSRDFGSARSLCAVLSQDSDANLRSAAIIIANILNFVV